MKVIDNVIVFTGASGGTGASTLLANTAYLASTKGLRVLVVDLNVMYPVQHVYFGDGKQELEKPDPCRLSNGQKYIRRSYNN